MSGGNQKVDEQPKKEGHLYRCRDGKLHLSECYMVMFPGPDAYCTCDDTSPEWTDD